jgi:endoglycosylceramidase
MHILPKQFTFSFLFSSSSPSVHNHELFLCLHFQDCFSERFCGEGVPLWAAEANSTFPLPLDAPWTPEGPQGVPSLEQCAKFSWSSYQFTYAGAKGYERLYLNEDGLADDFAAFWGYLANYFKGNNNILGFELLNEPFAGNYFKNPLLMFPGTADRERLQPFYDKVGRCHYY